MGSSGINESTWGSATLISVRIFTPTTSSLVVPPCTQVSLIVCKRKSPPLLHPPWRSRSLLHQKENTLSGSVVPSWLPSPPSKLWGSPRPNTTKPVHPSSTESASKCTFTVLCTFILHTFVMHTSVFCFVCWIKYPEQNKIQ